MISVFICMPYGDHNTLEVRQKNTSRAIETAAWLIDSGFLVYCPHLSHYINDEYPRDRMTWLNQSLNWLEKCDCVLAIGKTTPGMDKEICRAHSLCIPVFVDAEELAEAYGMEMTSW